MWTVREPRLPVSYLLDVLEEHCKAMGICLTQALEEKIQELSVRDFLRCLPNETIKETQWPSFLSEVLGRQPNPDLVDRIRYQSRGPTVDAEGYLELERRQNYRCALCGVVLVQRVKPHVDHVIPLALRGRNELSNYQLLCQQCNLGKSGLVGWIMGAPFLQEGLSYRLRYCVLTRVQGRCARQECTETTRTSPLEVLPVVPVQRGGRLIFDNLEALCTEHAESQRRTWKAVAVAKNHGRQHQGWSPKVHRGW